MEPDLQKNILEKFLRLSYVLRKFVICVQNSKVQNRDIIHYKWILDSQQLVYKTMTNTAQASLCRQI